MVSPASKRRGLSALLGKGFPRRLSCRVVGLSRSASRHQPRDRDPGLRARVLELAEQHPRAGFRQIHSKLPGVNLKAVHRIWKEEGLSQKVRKVRRLKVDESPAGRPSAPDQVWSVDFACERLENGRQVRVLAVVDAFTRECLALRARPSFRACDLVRELEWLFLVRGRPAVLRSDNGPEFRSRRLREWLEERGVTSGFIQPGSPWQNGHVESFFGKLRREVLDCELFARGSDLQARLDEHMNYYNQARGHSALGYLTPAQFHRHP